MSVRAIGQKQRRTPVAINNSIRRRSRSSAVSRYDEAEQDAKRRSRNPEQIDRHEIANVVVQENPPRLRRRRAQASGAVDSPHGHVRTLRETTPQLLCLQAVRSFQAGQDIAFSAVRLYNTMFQRPRRGWHGYCRCLWIGAGKATERTMHASPTYRDGLGELRADVGLPDIARDSEAPASRGVLAPRAATPMARHTVARACWCRPAPTWLDRITTERDRLMRRNHRLPAPLVDRSIQTGTSPYSEKAT